MPTIEFLEYLTPRDGRSMPADARANDLIHWQTTLLTRHVSTVAQQLRSAFFTWVSAGVVTLSGNHLGFTQGILVRGPDGHVLQLVEP